nr:hypothetical protein [Tanacetum cinerariifolium]
MDQNINFSGSDQIQTPQYPDVHLPSQEMNEEYSKPEDPNELFYKLLGDLKELAEYENSQSRDHPIFLNDDEDHSDQNKECFENSSNEIAISNPNQEKEEPPQDFDIHQLIEECSTKVYEEQKQSMEDMMLELVKICRQKELLCMYDNVDDLIESALSSKLLSINSNYQRLDKKEQEVKNVVEQPVERGNRIAPILSPEEPEHSLSIGECEVTLEDESKCDMPIQNQSSLIFTTFSNPLFKDNDDLDSSDDESLPDEDVLAEEFKVYSNPLFDEDEINSDKLDPHCFNVESDFVESLLNRNTFIDSSSKFYFSGEFAHVNLEIKESDFDFKEEIHLIENLLYDNSSPRSSEKLSAEIADTIVKSIPSLPIPVQDGDSQREEIDIVTKMNDVLPSSVENDDDSSNDPLLEEASLFLSDNSIPSGIENFADDPEGDIHTEFDFKPNAKEIPFVMNDKDEDVDYSSLIFVIFDKVFSLLSAESEDTIFDPEPENLPSMGYENLNTTSKTESDEIIKSGVEELLLILYENKVTLEDKRECYLPVCKNSPICDDHYEIFSYFINDDDISVYNDDLEDIEFVEASLSNPEIVSVEEENVVQQEEEEEVDLEDISQI